MSKNKTISWNIINFVVFLALVLAINVWATQYVAKSFGYDRALGNSLYGIYNPFAWIVWSSDFSHTLENGEFFKWLFVKVAFMLLAVLAIFGFGKLFFGRKARSYDDVHGSAHWATRDEIENMGILNNDEGVYIGAVKDEKSGRIEYLRHNGPEHVMAFAPTRSGKGVGLVLPTLLSWQESVIVLDIKGENWALTSGWRSKYAKNKVLKFDPSSSGGTSAKFNPLEEIDLDGDNVVGETQNIAMMIIDPDGKGLNDYWAKAGFSITVAFILHTLYKARKEGYSPTLSSIYQTINDENKEIREVLEEMMTYPHLENGTTHSVVSGAAREALNKADSELSGVISTMSSNLGLYADPIISNNISKSDFRIKDLMNHESPVSLYLVIKPKEMDRMRPLIRIIVNQILRTLIDDMKFGGGTSIKGYKHRLLLLLDEFTSLGKLEIFEQALAYMAGYGIKSYIIIQDLMQLYKHYTKEESIISNSHVRVAYAPNKVETAELLSKMCGQKTVVKTVRTASGKRTGLTLDNISENYQEVQRPLLTVDECMTLPGMKKDGKGNVIEAGDMLIFIAGNPAVYGKQILYFKDDTFLSRAQVEAPQNSDVLQKSEAKTLERPVSEDTGMKKAKETDSVTTVRIKKRANNASLKR